MVDDNNLEEEGRYNYQEPAPPPLKPGDPGYRLAPWAPDYDPGPNWNNGIAPSNSDPYQNYNGGSPVNAPLQAGYGWEWAGPMGFNELTAPTWNMNSNQWDFGRWNQVQGRGIGYVAPVETSDPPPLTPSDGGGGGTTTPLSPKLPSSTLPSDISAQFSTTPMQTPVQSAYQTALLKFLDQSQQTPSLDDPILGPQAEIFRVQQQRNQERNRRSAVERAAVTGLNSSGAIDRKIERGEQEQRFNTAQFNAGLLGRELDKRRQELQVALQLAASTGNQEATRELQTRLARVNTMMQQQSLSLQGQLGFGDLALRALMAEMGNNQFYDQLGINTALGLEGLNQRAVQFLGL